MPVVQTKKDRIPITEDSSGAVRFNADGSVDMIQKNPETGDTIMKRGIDKSSWNAAQDLGSGSGQLTPNQINPNTGKVIDPKTAALANISRMLVRLKAPRQMQQSQSGQKDYQQIQQNNAAEQMTPTIADMEKSIEAKRSSQVEELLPLTTEAQKQGKGALSVLGVVADTARIGLLLTESSKALILSKDTKQVSDYKTIVSETSNLIDTQIDMVANGQLDESKVINSINEAVEANVILERNVKKRGMDNVVYWLRPEQGAALQAQINLNRQNLEEKRLKLIAAIQSRNAIQGQQQQILGDLADQTRRLQAA